MDSMRNLRGSLPRPGAHHRQAPTADLLQTFKQAALNVTNLYRQATEDMALERRAGYQDAIYELLSLLDKENIGLGDGEGWRIRQWATEKQQLGPERDPVSDGHDSEANEEERETSPVQEEEPAVAPESSPVRETRQESDAPTVRQEPQAVPTGDFTFSSGMSYPEMQAETSQSSDSHSVGRTVARQGSGLRGSRRTHHAHQRQGTRSARTLGAGAGSKRKEHFGDLFGLGNMDSFKDPFSGHGPKRPRPT